MVTGDPKFTYDDVADADARYEPIPTFSEWLGSAVVELAAWDEARDRIAVARGRADVEVLARAREMVARVAAIETGLLEELYEVDAGFTFSAAFSSALVAQATLKEVEEEKRNLIQSQFDGYGAVIDLVTGQRPLAEAWVRELHGLICAGQTHYRVLTPAGWQNHPLEHGAYKTSPNHVRQGDGSVFSYAPVHDTAPEMRRLFEQTDSEEFKLAHPAAQAAYVHHSLTRIHPFSDGNGRVARAVASVFTFRELSVPALVFGHQKQEYLRTMRLADRGSVQDLCVFIARCGTGAVDMFVRAIDIALEEAAEDLASAISALYETSAGYTHAQVDDAAAELVKAFKEAVAEELDAVRHDNLDVNSTMSRNDYRQPYRAGYRPPVEGKHFNTVTVEVSTPSPAGSSEKVHLRVEVPQDTTNETPFYLHSPVHGVEYTFPSDAVLPSISAAARVVARLAARDISQKVLKAVLAKARESLSKGGY
ncbi:Fic family protein [Gaopeijia maritima]|uniref:Fic family protein n=1 Tax=Gaopeijia maritima TaxID=3119007 RepID=UPI0032484A83